MRVHVTLWFCWLATCNSTVTRPPIGSPFGMRTRTRYVALPPAAIGHLPLVKLLQTLRWAPKGKLVQTPAKRALTMPVPLVRAAAVLNVNNISDVWPGLTMQLSLLQLDSWILVGLGCPPPPKCVLRNWNEIRRAEHLATLWMFTRIRCLINALQSPLWVIESRERGNVRICSGSLIVPHESLHKKINDLISFQVFLSQNSRG